MAKSKCRGEARQYSWPACIPVLGSLFPISIQYEHLLSLQAEMQQSVVLTILTSHFISHHHFPWIQSLESKSFFYKQCYTQVSAYYTRILPFTLSSQLPFPLLLLPPLPGQVYCLLSLFKVSSNIGLTLLGRWHPHPTKSARLKCI